MLRRGRTRAGDLRGRGRGLKRRDDRHRTLVLRLSREDRRLSHQGLLLVIRHLLEWTTEVKLLASLSESLILKFPIIWALPPNLSALSL
jgi:hypothetical protein